MTPEERVRLGIFGSLISFGFRHRPAALASCWHVPPHKARQCHAIVTMG